MATAPAETVITPFSVSPDPTAVFVTNGWRSTVYKTRYAIEHRQGLAAILGDPGLGKSTLLRYLYAQFSAIPSMLCTFIPTPNFKSDFAMLRKLCDDFGVERERSMLAQQTGFEEWLAQQYADAKNVCIFLDEAQKLDSSQLELVRTALNFESHREKLVQIVLAGNLELRDRLLQKKNKPLASRIFAPSLINTMTYDEMVGMLQVRCDRESIQWPFSDEALKVVYEFSGGVPRTILKVCEFAYARMRDEKLRSVSPDIITAITREMRLDAEAA